MIPNPPNTGGYLIPEKAITYKEKDGLVWGLVRWLGENILHLGKRLRSYGYKEVVSYPHAELMQNIKDLKASYKK